MENAVRILMWTHFVYLLLLPTLSVIAAIMMFGGDLWTIVLIAGFPPVVMYSLFLANGYTLPNSLPVILFVVFGIPMQIAVSILLFGGGSVWLFFAESAAVEIGALVLGVLFVALKNRQAEYSTGGFSLLLFLAVALFAGGVVPQFVSVLSGYGGPSFWMILFATAFATGFWDYTKVYRKLTTRYQIKGETQNLEMRFDSKIASRLFRVGRNVELLSPLWNTADHSAINKRVWIFGFVSMFLPIPAGVITAAVLGQL